jgi:hypothetical protein
MKSKHRNKRKNAGRKRSRAKAKLFYFVLIGALAGALVLFVTVGGAGNNRAPDIIPGGSLAAAEDFHNFGSISMRDGKVAHTFRLKNPGAEPALIRKLYTS